MLSGGFNMAETFKINIIEKHYKTFEVVAENKNQAIENIKDGKNITEVDTGYEDDGVMIEYYDAEWDLIH